MNRRPGFIIIIILFVTVIVGFYIYLKKQQSPDIDAISAIPVNSALLIEINDPSSFLSKITENNRLTAELFAFNEVSNLLAKTIEFDSLMHLNEKLAAGFKERVLTISLHEVGNKQFEWLYLTHLSGRLEANQLIKYISSLVHDVSKLTESKYNQVKVYTYKDLAISFHFAFHRGILMGSKSEILLQDAIRQVEIETGIGSQAGFSDLKKTAGTHADANIFLNYVRFNSFYTKIVDAGFIKERGIDKLGDWIELDLNLKSQTLLLNGFANDDNNIQNFYSLFKNQSPQNLRFIKFVPTGAESFCAFGLSNLSVYQQQLQKHMESLGQKERYLINQQQLIAALGKTFNSELQETFENELALVTFADGSNVFYLKTKGYNHAQELMQKWVGNYAKSAGVSPTPWIHEYKIDNESSFPIYKFPIDYFPLRMFGPWFKTCKATYVTVFDDYFIFGESVHALSRIIYNNVLQKTLVFDAAYNQYTNFLSNKVNFYSFVSLSGTGNFLDEFLTHQANKYYTTNKTVIRNFYAVSWQFAAENNMYYNNFLIRHQPSNKIKAATEWETRLDTTIAFKPQLMINHYTHEKEIFVQDMKHNIYLINKSGRILWKKKLDEPILSEVNQVDYYKNGKLQYLFNTKSTIHMLDRNGNFVERYPIKLPSKAVNALSIFDYENRKNYRVFVPTEDKQVYCYDIEGRIVSGFKFSGADNSIISPIQYVKDNNKEYLLVTDVSRIYLLDRRGTARLKLNKQFNPSKNNIFEYQAGTSSRRGRLVRTDENGTIYYIYFNGTVESSPMEDFSPNHYFKIEDVTGDRVADLVYVDGKKLTVYSVSGKKQFYHVFSTEIKDEPSFYKFSANQTGIGITESEARKIYLINNEGKFMEGFPLPGKTRFSIGVLDAGSGKFNLIVGGDEQYLFNFKLN